VFREVPHLLTSRSVVPRSRNRLISTWLHLMASGGPPFSTRIWIGCLRLATRRSFPMAHRINKPSSLGMDTRVESVLTQFRVYKAIGVKRPVQRSWLMHARRLIQIHRLVYIHQRNVLLDLSLVKVLVRDASLNPTRVILHVFLSHLRVGSQHTSRGSSFILLLPSSFRHCPNRLEETRTHRFVETRTAS